MLPEPCDDFWPIVSAGHQQDLLDHFAETVQARLWERAGNFFEGKGLNGGADLFAPKALLNRYQKQGRYADYGLLSAICVGDLWPAARRHEQGMIAVPTCPRCGEAPETLTHRHWHCEANSLIFEPEVVTTQFFCERAMAEAEDTPCFWNRGIVPLEWTVLPPPSDDQHLIGYGNWSLFKETSVLYTDASRGNHTRDKRLRRVGWAVVAVGSGRVPDLLAAQGGPLPGTKQSVSRGKLFAAVAALKMADSSRPLELVPDCMNVVIGAQRTSPFTGKRHADLWHEFRRLKGLFREGLVVRHVQSHVPAQLLWPGTVNIREILWATRLRMPLRAKRLPCANPLMVRLATSRKLTSSAGKSSCESQRSRVRLLNKYLTLGLRTQMATSRNQTRGSSLLPRRCLPLVRGRSRRQRRNTCAISIELATPFFGVNLDGTAPDACRRTPKRSSQNGRELALAQAYRVAACLRLSQPSWDMKGMPAAQLSWLRHYPRLQLEGWQPASCILRIMVTGNAATSGAASAELGDPPSLASFASRCSSARSKAGKEVPVRVRKGLTPKSEAKWPLEDHEAPPEGPV